MKFTLFTSVAAIALISGAAYAQDAVVATTAAVGEPETTEVVILGHGQSRQTQSIRAQDLTEVAPGTSPLKVLDKLPGVSFQSADPFGAYEWSTRISVRGFNQNQMGFTLDGVTLGDMSYGNYNGLHISRAIINEDIARVELAQGAGGLDTASTSNMGGTLKFVSRDPSQDMGGELDATVGTESMHRLYGRFETGAIEALGNVRGYISAVDQGTDKWKGFGQQKAQQVDFKAVLPLADAGSFTLWANHSDRKEQDYQDMSFDMIKRLGYNSDNFQPNYAKAVGVAGVLNNPALYMSGVLDPSSGYWTGAGTNPYATYGVANPDDAYYYGAGVRKDTIYGAKIDFALSARIHLNGQVYHHDNVGQGLWVTPYSVSPNYGVPGATTDNAPLSVRTTEYDIDRTGAIAGVAIDLGAHQITAGAWTEVNNFNQARRFYAENASAPTRDSLGFQQNPYKTSWAYAFTTDTVQAYVQDTWQVNEALKVNYGFKALNVTNKVEQTAGGTIKAKLQSKDGFLPQIGAVYKFGNGYEVFGSYAKNMDAYVSAATSGPFSSQNQANIDFVRDHLEPETSKTIEGGLRVRQGAFQGVAALYHVDFDHRILAVAQGPGIQGNAPVLSNVGGVKSQGIELAGSYRVGHVTAYEALTFNDSTYNDDVIAADGTIKAHTNGKTVVNTPKVLSKTELSYNNGPVSAVLGVSYTGDRYYTYENIGGKVDASTVADLSLGYHFNAGVTMQLNITNLTDKEYISTVGSNGFTNNDASGTSQTILTGAPRQMFLSVKKSF